MTKLEQEVLAILKERGMPLQVVTIYEVLVANGSLPFERDAMLYPQHPMRQQIAAAVAMLAKDGALA